MSQKIIERMERLQDEIMEMRCGCNRINSRMLEISEELNTVCCAKCCHCHWERAGQDLE